MDLFMFFFSSKCNNNESLHESLYESFLADFFFTFDILRFLEYMIQIRFLRMFDILGGMWP